MEVDGQGRTLLKRGGHHMSPSDGQFGTLVVIRRPSEGHVRDCGEDGTSLREVNLTEKKVHAKKKTPEYLPPNTKTKLWIGSSGFIICTLQ